MLVTVITHRVNGAWQGSRPAFSLPPPLRFGLLMDYARAWLPKTKLKFIPLVLGSVLFIWVLLPFPGPLPGRRPHPGFRSHGRPPRTRPYPPPHPHTIWQQRAEQVKDAFLHAYDGYLKYAALHDELLPVSNAAVDKCVTLCPLMFSIYL